MNYRRRTRVTDIWAYSPRKRRAEAAPPPPTQQDDIPPSFMDPIQTPGTAVGITELITGPLVLEDNALRGLTSPNWMYPGIDPGTPGPYGRFTNGEEMIQTVWWVASFWLAMDFQWFSTIPAAYYDLPIAQDINEVRSYWSLPAFGSIEHTPRVLVKSPEFDYRLNQIADPPALPTQVISSGLIWRLFDFEHNLLHEIVETDSRNYSSSKRTHTFPTVANVKRIEVYPKSTNVGSSALVELEAFPKVGGIVQPNPTVEWFNTYVVNSIPPVLGTNLISTADISHNDPFTGIEYVDGSQSSGIANLIDGDVDSYYTCPNQAKNIGMILPSPIDVQQIEITIRYTPPQQGAQYNGQFLLYDSNQNLVLTTPIEKKQVGSPTLFTIPMYSTYTYRDTGGSMLALDVKYIVINWDTNNSCRWLSDISIK